MPQELISRRRAKAEKPRLGKVASATFGDIRLELHARQGGKCAICGTQYVLGLKRLALDHCHETGRIRGLLCGSCNRGLGLFRDNPERLRKAIEYLGK